MTNSMLYWPKKYICNLIALAHYESGVLAAGGKRGFGR